MGLFNLFKKPPPVTAPTGPYKETGLNLIYNLLFCDDLELYKKATPPPLLCPYDILFADAPHVQELQTIIDDPTTDPRLKLLAYNKQRAAGQQPAKKELLAVIVEVGVDGGLDVLASFANGTARYINQTGKLLIWETADATSDDLTKELFAKSENIMRQIGPWDKERKLAPTTNNARISFLVSDGLYFGEAPSDVLFNDPLAADALVTATRLMQYITEKAISK